MVALVCQSRQIIEQDWTGLPFKLVPVLYAQLKDLPPDFFGLEEFSGNFLQTSMSQLIEHSAESPSGLQARVAKLQEMLTRDLGFIPRPTEEQQLDCLAQGQAESDEELPMVVDCEEKYLF